jgi:hypothetical protein
MLAYCKMDPKHDIYECCDFPHQPPGNGTGDCCYDYWNADLTEISNDLKFATARATHKQKEFQYVSDWYAVLKGWCDDWEQTDNKADALCRNLDLFIKHLKRVCKITNKTDRAIDILFCMIKDLFIRVDCLKERYDDLYKCINCLKNPALASGGIRACLDDYGKKLDAVIALRDLLLGKIISCIEYGYELHDNICDDYGLRSTLVFWRQILKCEGEIELPGKPEDPEEPMECCELEPMMTLPISQDVYFIDLKLQTEQVKIRVHELKKESDQANEKMAALQACQDGLNTALKASDPSIRCKK